MMNPTVHIPFDRCFDEKLLKGLCTEVYDGDSIKVVLPLAGKQFLVTCRLVGIDTAEIRGTKGDEKQKALDARNRLREWILDKDVWCECGRMDKYGRLLVTVYAGYDNTISCNQRLINEGLALAYDGGKKKTHKNTN